MPAKNPDSPDQEILDALRDVEGEIAEFDRQQAALAAERYAQIDRAQGTQAMFEKQVSEYERDRDALELSQQDLDTRRKPFDEAREALRSRLAPTLSTGAQAAEPEQPSIDRADAGSVSLAPGTRDDIEKLKEQRDKPALEHTLGPPGMAQGQAAAIAKDLAERIQAKQARLDSSSDDLKNNWNHRRGPKP